MKEREGEVGRGFKDNYTTLIHPSILPTNRVKCYDTVNDSNCVVE